VLPERLLVAPHPSHAHLASCPPRERPPLVVFFAWKIARSLSRTHTGPRSPNLHSASGLVVMQDAAGMAGIASQAVGVAGGGRRGRSPAVARGQDGEGGRQTAARGGTARDCGGVAPRGHARSGGAAGRACSSGARRVRRRTCGEGSFRQSVAVLAFVGLLSHRLPRGLPARSHRLGAARSLVRPVHRAAAPHRVLRRFPSAPVLARLSRAQASCARPRHVSSHAVRCWGAHPRR